MDVSGDGLVSFDEFEDVMRGGDNAAPLHPDELAEQMCARAAHAMTRMRVGWWGLGLSPDRRRWWPQSGRPMRDAAGLTWIRAD